MSWCDIELHTGGEDTGTSAFGVASKGQSGYQVEKLATIVAGGKVSQQPVISSCSTKDCVCFAIDSNVYVIDHTRRDEIFDLSLSETVDCVALSQNSGFLAVGDRKGQLHFIDVALRKRIFSEVLVSAENVTGQRCFHSATFWSTSSEPGHSLVVATAAGMVYYFSRMALEELHDGMVDGDFVTAQEIRKNIVTKVFKVAELHGDWIGEVLPIQRSGMPAFLVTGKGRCSLSVWGTALPISSQTETSTDIVLLDAISRPLASVGGVKRAQLTQDGGYLILLSESGKLSVWDPKSFVFVSNLSLDDNKQVLDFRLANSVGKMWRKANKNSLGNDEPQLVLLTQSGSKHFLEVRSFPSFQAMYCKAVTRSAHLSMPVNALERLFVLNDLDEFVSLPGCSTAIPSRLCIHCFSEAIPEKRLALLLRKGKFDEALLYAEQFGLDVQVVSEARCSWLLQSPGWDVESHQKELLDKLVAAFDSVLDTNFVLQCCLDDPPACQMATAAMLKYADKRLTTRLSNRPGPDEQAALIALKQELETAIIRFGTYQLAFGAVSFSPSHWQSFRASSIIPEIYQCLVSKNLAAATVMWRRHKTEVHGSVTVDSLQRLLSAVPDSLPSKKLVGWLRDALLPSFVEVLFPNAEAENMLSSWVKERALRLELTEKAHWPGNALSMVTTVATALHSPHSRPFGSSSTTTSSTSRGIASHSPATGVSGMRTPARFVTQVTSVASSNSAAAENDDDALIRNESRPLQGLLQQLTDLQLLHTRYRFPMSLGDFLLESNRTRVFRLLERVAAVEVIEQALTQHIVPYCRQNLLNSDQVLLDYIKDFIANHGHLWRNYAGSTVAAGTSAPWEAKLLAIVPHIKTMECRVSAVFELIRVAALPWSSAMDTLVKQAMTWEHLRHRELLQQVRTAQLCSMLHRYGISNVNLKQSALAKDMLRRIVHSEEDTCMDDALELVSVFHNLDARDAYAYRLKWLCSRDKVSAISELIKSLTISTAASVTKDFVRRCFNVIETFTFDNPNAELTQIYQKCYKQLILAACASLEALFSFSSYSAPLDLVHHMDILMRMLKLSHEFSLHAKASEFLSEDSRVGLVACWLHTSQWSLSGDASTDESSSLAIQKVQRLSLLLELSYSTVLLQCIRTCLDSDDLVDAIRLCRALLDCDASPGAISQLQHVLHCLQDKVLQTYQSGCRGSFADNTTVETSNLAEECLQLSTDLPTRCASYDMVDISALAKSARRLYDLCKACSTTSHSVYDSSSEWQWTSDNTRTFSKLITGDTFQEDSLVLSPAEVLPVLQKFNQTILPSTTTTTTTTTTAVVPRQHYQLCVRPFEQSVADTTQHTATPGHLAALSTAAQQMTSVLVANGCCQLAMSYASEALYQCLECFAVNYCDSCKDNAVKEALEDTVAIVIMKAPKVISGLWENLLSKVLAYRTLDLSLALGYMLQLPASTVFKALNQSRLSSHGDHTRLQALAWLGWQYLKLAMETTSQRDVPSSPFNDTAMQQCKKTYDLATWGVRLAKYRIQLPDNAHQDRAKQKEVLHQMLNEPTMELSTLLDFCRYFDFNRERLLQLRVEGCILPQPNTHDSSLPGAMAIVMSEPATTAVPSVEELTAIAQQAAMQKDMLQVVFEAVQKIDPYDYERISCALSLLKRLWPKDEEMPASIKLGPRLLDMLQHYQRRFPPGPAEVKYVTKPAGDEIDFLQPAKKMPELSSSRLPFHMLLFGSNALKMLSTEATVETVSTLVPLALLVKIPADQLHMTAIQNTVNAYLAAKKRTSSWPAEDTSPSRSMLTSSSASSSSGLLSSLKSSLFAIQDMKNASATTAWVHSRLDKGPEKLEALNVCLQLAENWARTATVQESMSQANKSHGKFLVLHNQLAVELLLQQMTPYSQSEVESLSALPVEQLILQLYQHASIAWSARGQVAADFDIHSVVDKTSAIYDIDGDNVRLQLVKKWLPTAASRRDQTALWSQRNINFAEEEREDEVNLQRVIFLLLHPACNEKGALYLLQYAYKETASKITNTCKARAMRVLFAVVPDIAMLERISQLKAEELWAYLYSLVCVAELDRLRISQSLSTFQHCNKEGLVRGLLKNHSTSPLALRFAVGFSLDHHLYDVALWGDLLQQMLKLEMLNDLQQSLISASYVPQLLKIPRLLQLWQAVLTQPLADAHAPVTGDMKTSCSNVLHLLTLCPLVVDIDTVSLTNNYLRLQLPCHALCCALVAGGKSLLVEAIVEQSGVAELTADMRVLSEDGFSLADQALVYLEQLDESQGQDGIY
ncbi:kinetochore-associated protein 1-like isoform X2 [Sycon ciliatum]|uniref:kinetochore-associated protein 1-like isoform X2 n=1 Tax=Sycon ciliatum TaxID=27933 RepID=UPI0031F67680